VDAIWSLIGPESLGQGRPCAFGLGRVQAIGDATCEVAAKAVPILLDVRIDDTEGILDHLNIGEASVHDDTRQIVGFGDPAWRPLIVVPQQAQLAQNGMEILGWGYRGEGTP
jgi:hypothetical protein